MSGWRISYAKVSASDQNPKLHLDAVPRADCERMFTETASCSTCVPGPAFACFKD